MAHAARRLPGEVVLLTPLSNRLLSMLLVTVAAGALLFAGSAHYVPRIHASGRLAPKAAATGGGATDAHSANQVPREAELVGEINLPASSIALVRPGQRVRLRYPAIPNDRYGSKDGTVISVSPQALSSTGLNPSQLDAPAPVFRVRVGGLHQSVESFGREMPLQPGMRFEADIALPRRSLLESLLEPLRTGRHP